MLRDAVTDKKSNNKTSNSLCAARLYFTMNPRPAFTHGIEIKTTLLANKSQFIRAERASGMRRGGECWRGIALWCRPCRGFNLF